MTITITGTGIQGPTGPGPISIAYTFSTTTTDADPGSGFMRLGSATQNTATVIRCDLNDVNGVDHTSAFTEMNSSSSIANKGYIRIVHAFDQTKWLLFKVTAVATPSGYRNLTVAIVSSSSSSPFGNNDPVILNFGRTGDKGDGSGGAIAVLSVKDFGALGDGSTNDRTAIQNALNAAVPGQIVFMPDGLKYAIGSTIDIPPGVTLMGTIPRGRMYFSDFNDEKSCLYGLSSFSGTTMIRLSEGPTAGGSWAIDNHNAAVENVNLVGWDLPATVDGIEIKGVVQDLVIKNVLIQGVTNRGIVSVQNGSGDYPNTLDLDGVSTLQSNGTGFSLINYDDINAHNCSGDESVTGNGWTIQGCTNSNFENCRAEHNNQHGFNITGDWFSAEGSSGANFIHLTTDRNEKNGILVDARTGTGPMVFVGCRLGRDGRNGNSGGGNFAAFNVSHGTSVTNPITIVGLQTFPGVDDDGSGTNSPQIGLQADHATYVAVSSSYIHAATTAISKGTGNTTFSVSDCGTATGTTGSPTRSTYRKSTIVRATSTTAIGTSAGSITGLAATVPWAGTYRFRAWVPIVNIGGTTNVNFGLTGPSVSAVYYTVTRSVAAGTTAVDQYSAFTDAAAGTTIAATLAEIEGTFVATASGTVQVRGIRAGGTSATTQIGAYIEIDEVS